MNCANHPERASTAFCANCGKPLCAGCTRGPSAETGNLVLCEPCLQARQARPAAAAAWSTIPAGAGATTPPGSSAVWTPVPGTGARGYPSAGSHPSPFLAGLLGVIPGVGAMYNGQFIKALIHVVVFIVLIGIAQHFNLAGILIAAWFFYQVFDAAQTAAARRDGRPLPDPFGILDMSQRLGPQTYPAVVPPAGSPVSAVGSAPVPPPYASAASWSSPAPSFASVSAPAASGAPVLQAGVALQPRAEPVGAIVLIAVGCLFLLSTLGVLDVDWVSRGWPVLVLLLGIWLLIRRATAPSPFAPAPAAAVPETATPANSLSISPQSQPHQPSRTSSEEETL